MTPGSSAAHTALVNETLLKIGSLPFVRVWKRVVGTFYRVRFNPFGQVIGTAVVKVGTEGEPDIDGILTDFKGYGLRLGIECKTGNATQTPEQKKYQKMIQSMGGLYFVVYSSDEALRAVMGVRNA